MAKTETRVKVVFTKAGEAYSATQAYRLHDYIVLGGVTIYACKKVDPATMTCVGHPLTDTAYWDKFMDIADFKAAAEKATASANAAAKSATDAAGAAQAAKTAADEATTLTKAATEASEKATAAAKSATDKVLDTLGKIVPTGLFVESVPRLTLGNVNPVYLKAVLSPDTALKNLIYISDNRAVEVGLDGRISILNKGVSRVHIIPTCNTALARTVLIEVGEPTLRLVTTRRQMRFTQSGALRMN